MTVEALWALWGHKGVDPAFTFKIWLCALRIHLTDFFFNFSFDFFFVITSVPVNVEEDIVWCSMMRKLIKCVQTLQISALGQLFLDSTVRKKASEVLDNPPGRGVTSLKHNQYFLNDMSSPDPLSNWLGESHEFVCQSSHTHTHTHTALCSACTTHWSLMMPEDLHKFLLLNPL